jgi:hypothetical protein
MGCILTLAVAAGACGEAEKDPDAKALVLSAPVNRKAGPSMAQFAANGFTALAEGAAEKSSGQLTFNENLSGDLTTSDEAFPNGQHFDVWTFVLSDPVELTVAVRSDDFDTMLMVASDEEILASNDDFDGTNSGLTVTLEPGRYGVFVTSYGAGDTGAYRLRAETSGGSGGVLQGRLESGPTLQDGTYFTDFQINGQAGDRVTITMESSEFDTYLLLLQDGEIIASNDDAEGTNSQVVHVLPTTGSYTVRANSYAAGATGAFTIRVDLEEDAVRPFAGFGSGGDPNGRYALLVGIDDYPGTGSDLNGPVEDARIMERVLTEKFGFDPANIVTLNDADATRQNIATGIAQHLGQAGPDGVAVFFYSGHGTQIGENIGLTGDLDPEPRGQGDEAIYIYGHSYESSILLDEELGYLMESLGAGRKLVVVDACHSGEITRAGSGSPQSKRVDITDPEVAEHLQLPRTFVSSELKALDLGDMSLGFGDFSQMADVFRNPQTHIMWGSSTEDQVSFTSNLGNNASVFTYFVGEHIMNSPESITLGELQRMVHDDVSEWANEAGLTPQNPQMRGPNQNTSIGDLLRQR